MLLIENQETFQALSRTSVPEEWLCIWMEGYASEALVMLLTYMLGEEDDALAAWREQAETLIVTAPEAFRSLAWPAPSPTTTATAVNRKACTSWSCPTCMTTSETSSPTSAAPGNVRPDVTYRRLAVLGGSNLLTHLRQTTPR
ncbi:hypothetical protein ACFPC0_36405 [Streptomyces andamanensis]|uniref:Uncharacterized protein n=1 Tax=Streptomyces andamanensis TaxID=1565035 RepID=A0ABV8TRT5_9ACTN